MCCRHRVSLVSGSLKISVGVFVSRDSFSLSLSKAVGKKNLSLSLLSECTVQLITMCFTKYTESQMAANH